MAKIEEIRRIGIKEPFIISFSVRHKSFTVDFPVIYKEKIGKRNSYFDTYAQCIAEIDKVYADIMQEEILTRKVIYICMKTSCDEKTPEGGFQTDSAMTRQGLEWCWFVLDEYQVGERLMYKVIDCPDYAAIYRTRIDILPQLMFMYNDGKTILLDYDETLMAKIKEIEKSLEIGIKQIHSFFNVDKDTFMTNLLSMSDQKFLSE